MAMLAAPHPSLTCLTKGTSSQRPGVSANNIPQKHKAAKPLATRRNIGGLTDGDDDKDQCCDSNDDPDQVTVAEIASGEISLSFVRTRGQLGELRIVQVGYGILHLLRIHVSGLYCF